MLTISESYNASSAAIRRHVPIHTILFASGYFALFATIVKKHPVQLRLYSCINCISKYILLMLKIGMTFV